jgi:hypothetical protein
MAERLVEKKLEKKWKDATAVSFEVYHGICLGLLEKITKKLARLVRASAGIRTRQLPNPNYVFS